MTARKMLHVGGLALLVVLAACGSPTEDVGDELRDRQRRWRALGIHDYAFDFRRSCFCPGPIGMLQIVVRGDSVVSITDTATGQPASNLQPGWAGTIDQIFNELIRESTDAAEMDLAFDSQFHFPTHAAVDRIKNAIDDEFELTLTSFLPGNRPR